MTILLDFSFTARVGDTVMELAGAVQFLRAGNSQADADHDYLMDLIEAPHGATLRDFIAPYGVWFAFSFSRAHDEPVVYPQCLAMIRGF